MSFVSQFKAQARVMAGDLRHRKIIVMVKIEFANFHKTLIFRT